MNHQPDLDVFRQAFSGSRLQQELIAEMEEAERKKREKRDPLEVYAEFIRENNIVPRLSLGIELEKDEEAEAECHNRRQMAKCGWVHLFIDETGGFQKIQWWCGRWRTCPTCREHRMDRIQARLDRVVEAVDDLGIMVIDNAEGTKITRRIRLAGCEHWRLPIEGDLCVIFYDQGKFPLESEIEVADLDMEVLIETPKGKRMSGSLGNPEKKEAVTDSEVVAFKADHVEGLTDEQRSEAMRRTKEDTRHLNPEHNAEAVMEAIAEARAIFLHYVEAYGGEVTSTKVIKRRVSFSTYSGWQNIDAKRQRLQEVAHLMPEETVLEQLRLDEERKSEAQRAAEEARKVGERLQRAAMEYLGS